jgi:hypothetical protein
MRFLLTYLPTVPVDTLSVDLLPLESMEYPPTPRLKVIDLFLEYGKHNTTFYCENKDSTEEEILLFRGHDPATSSVDCGESSGLGLGIVVF